MFKISWGDLGRGLVVAVAAPLVTSVIGVLSTIVFSSGFDAFAVDWPALGKLLVNSSIVSAYGGFAGYITKQLITDNQGNIFGIGSD